MLHRDSTIPDLDGLDLEGIAVTAAIDSQGRLSFVGGLWEKLGKQLMDLAHRGLIRIVVVAEDQNDVPSQYLPVDAHPLRVVKAKSLDQAVCKVHEEARPRQAICEFERAATQYLDVLDRSLPINEHYQLLPLLREVRRERLPRESVGEERPSAERGVPAAELIRWEEELRQERVTFERLGLNDLLTGFRRQSTQADEDIPRFVVVGPPGSGKSALTQYLSWRAAHGELRMAGKRIVPARISLREWERWASKNDEKSLPVYLATRYADAGRHPPTPEDWRRLLIRGDVLLLLDGLDELKGDPAFEEALASALTAWRQCPMVLTCRTVSFEQHRSVCPDYPVFTLAGFDERQQESYVRGFPARRSGQVNADALLERLRLSQQLASLAANPLVLAILCYVLDRPRRQDVPTTRAAFYDMAVQQLLGRTQKNMSRENREKVVSLPLIRQRRILERAALDLFLGRGQGRLLMFDEATLLKALERGAEAEGSASPANVADALLDDLTQKPGILRGDAEQGYFFLHLSIQEFLAASALSRLANETETGWQTVVQADRGKRSVLEFIDRQAWDSGFENIVLFVAGLVADPDLLLDRLCDGSHDDISRHRLGLAGRCLAELPPDPRRTHSRRIDAITEKVSSLWWKHLHDSTEPLVAPLWRALPAVAQVNGHVHPEEIEALTGHGSQLATMPLLDYLIALFKEPDPDVLTNAGWTIASLGPAAATAQVIAELIRVLRQGDVYGRAAAAVALGGLGPVAATREVLTELTRQLSYPDRHVTDAIAHAFRGFGSAAATREVLAELIRLLNDQGIREWPTNRDTDAVWCPAAAALGALGAAAATPDVLGELIRMLGDTNIDVSRTAEEAFRGPRYRAAVEAFSELGSAAALPEVLLSELLEMLGGPDTFGRFWAAEVISSIGPAAATEEMFANLNRMLNGADEDAWYYASRLISGLGAVAGRNEILSPLIRLLRHPNFLLRSAAGGALYRIGPASITPELLAELTQMLGDQDEGNRSRAASLIGNLGSVAATPDLLDGLSRLSSDPVGNVRSAGVRAIGRLAMARNMPGPLADLTRMFSDPEGYVRRAAAEAISDQGPIAAIPQVIAALSTLLNDPEGYVQRQAAEALGVLGPKAATTGVLSELKRLLQGPHAHLRTAAATTISNLQGNRFRFLRSASGEWAIRTIEELVQA